MKYSTPCRSIGVHSVLRRYDQFIVIFACVHNAGRSQMAAAWFERLADPARARAVSAIARSCSARA